jgi:hypothetical protein
MELFSGRKNTIGMPNLLEKFLLVAGYLILDTRFQILDTSNKYKESESSKLVSSIEYLKTSAGQSCLFYCIYLFKQVEWFISTPFWNFH